MKENIQHIIIEIEVLNRDLKKLQNTFTLKNIDKIVAKSGNIYSFPNKEIKTEFEPRNICFRRYFHILLILKLNTCTTLTTFTEYYFQNRF